MIFDCGITSNVNEFADGTKICRLVKSDNNAMVLQNDLTNLHEWARKWLTTFNTDKCSVLSVGKNNPR